MTAANNRTVVEGVQKMTPSEAFVETCVANGVTETVSYTHLTLPTIYSV